MKKGEKMSQQNELLEAAKKYLSMGFSVIPVGRNKKPIIKAWKYYQDNKPKENEVEFWFTKTQAKGVAIITGKISNLAVIDFEKGAKIFDLPETVVVKTGGGGKHYYFKYPAGRQLKTKVRQWDLTDLKADGGYVVAPPSVHATGAKYAWEVGFDQAALADFPEHLLDVISDQAAQSRKTDFTQIVSGVPEGGRNDAATRMIGKLAYHLPESEWPVIAWPLVKAWNMTNNPPLPENELAGIFQSICQKQHLQRHEDSADLGSPLHIAELLAEPDEPVDWIIQDLLFSRSINIISAPPKNFKTWVLLHIACQVAAGQKLFGQFTTKPTKILFIQEEDFKTIVKRRLKAFSDTGQNEIYFWIQRGFKIDKDAHLNALIEYIKQHNIGLVLMDSFRRITNLAENESKEVAIFFSRVMELTKIGATVLITHHDRKDNGFGPKSPEQRMRGSSDIFAAVHGHLSIERNFQENTLLISQGKIKVQEELSPFVVKILSDKQTGQVGLEFAGAVPQQLAQKERAKELIPSILANGEMKQSEIVRALGAEVGKQSVVEALHELVQDGDLSISRKGKGGANYYALAEVV